MKTFLITMIGLVMLAGCGTHYDYFRGDIRYVQDGRDCIYSATEYGENYSADIRGMDNEKKIIYRDTMCADLYARDNAHVAPRRDRSMIVPVPGDQSEMDNKPSTQPVKETCGCGMANGNDAMVLRRRYIIVPTNR